MNIPIDNDQLKSIVSEAILRSLDDQKRNALITDAIQSLLVPKDSPYSREKISALQEAFRQGIYTAAVQIATKELAENSEVQQKIRGLLNDALVRLTETHRLETVTRIAEAIQKGMAYKEY